MESTRKALKNHTKKCAIALLATLALHLSAAGQEVGGGVDKFWAGANYDGAPTGGDGESWTDAANWIPAGVPQITDSVRISAGTVLIPESAAAKSLEVGGGAVLNLGATGTLRAAIPTTTSALSLNIAQDVLIAGQVALGGKNNAGGVTFFAGGNLTLASGGALAVYAGAVEEDPSDVTAYVGDGASVAVGGDLSIAAAAWIYPYSQTTNAGNVRITIAGDAFIAQSAGIDASGAGYEFHYGPGTTFTTAWSDGDGGSYGGVGGKYDGQGAGANVPETMLYGYANAPFCSGSSGMSSGNASKTGDPGGGAIRLHVGGEVMLEGSLLANGYGQGFNGNNSGAGSGGGIWVTCSEFSASDGASIAARGGNTTYGWSGSGGGGRVCIITGEVTEERLDSLYATGTCEGLIILTTNPSDPIQFAYPELISAAAGSVRAVSKNWGLPGTTVIARLVSADSALVFVDADPAGVVVQASSSPDLSATFSGTLDCEAFTPAFAAESDSRSRYHCLGYVCRNDAEEIISSGSESSVTLSAADGAIQYLTWQWGNLEDLISVSAEGAGSLSGEGWHRRGEEATFVAAPAAGWAFAGWGGDVPFENRFENPLTLVIDSPREIKAIFIPVHSPGGLTITAIKNGEWFEPSTWSGGMIPNAEDDVLISGKTVFTDYLFDCEAKSLSLENSARLELWSEITFNPKQKKSAFTTGDEGALQLKVGGNLNIAGASALTLGADNSFFHPTISARGDLQLSENAALTIYAGVVPTNNLLTFAAGGAKVEVRGAIRLESNSWIYPYSHPTNGASPVFRAKSAAIAQTAGFNANLCGFAYPYGPGTILEPTTFTWVEGYGASYGGLAGRFQTKDPTSSTYGYAWAPFWPGSSGTSNGTAHVDPIDTRSSRGGGAIIISVSGTFNLAGTLRADGVRTPLTYHDSGVGTGGTIWITCRHINIDPETALVSASSNDVSYGGAGPSGGGRICVIEGDALLPAAAEELVSTGYWRFLKVVTEKLDDPDESPWPGVFSVNGGNNSNSYYINNGSLHSPGENGTAVYLQTSPRETLIFLR